MRKIESKPKLEDDVDALFRLPLTEFISARKTLATRLKKEGHGDQADRVKALVKPSISAWTVNQLYWQHREAFNRLIATGQRFRLAQSALLSGKVADMRGPLEARREVLAELSQLATALLVKAGQRASHKAGHNPTPEMIRRVTTTLEALSAYASLPDDLVPGRLTQDVDPPGFDSLAFGSGAMPARTAQPARVIPFRKNTAATNVPRKAVPSIDARQIEKTRQAKIAAANTSVQEAKRALVKARARAQNAATAQKRAQVEAKQKEKQKREAETRLEQARAASEAAARRAQSVAAEVEAAAKALEGAEHTLEVASKELESLRQD
jgi:hypothetical protein